jgi:GNAT superfamily N-acetyltransferase
VAAPEAWAPLKKDRPLTFQALTAGLWDDLQAVLGARGGHNGCWCMRWRLPRPEFERRRGDANRRALRAGIVAGRIGGVLAYLDGRPVGWCAIGPRTCFPVLDDTDILARVDGQSVWSIGCCYLARGARRLGYLSALIEAAVDYAANSGAEIVEAYPLAPRTPRVPVAAAWTGFESAYREVGFEEVARRVDVRPVMRLRIEPHRA